MSVQLYNDTASIRLVRGSDTYNIDRSCDLRVYGSQLHITTAGGKEIHVIEFSEVTVPVVANIAALRTAVEAWKEDTFSATIDTTVFTDGSQKTQIVDSNGDSLGTPTNPISVDANLNVETEGLSTFQQQYNQTEILQMIWEELQEQTRILKKIYQ